MSSIALSSSLLICFSTSSNLLLNPSSVFLSSVIICVILSYIFYLFVVLTMFVHSSPKFYEHHLTIILSFLSGRLIISVLFSSFSVVLSCSFDRNIFLCFLILPNFLCLFLYIK